MVKAFQLVFFIVMFLSRSNCQKSYDKGNIFSIPNHAETLKNILEGEIEIIISSENNDIIRGLNGTIAFKTEYNDGSSNIFDLSDIENKTIQTTELKEQNSGNTFITRCRLWKSTKGDISLFCNIEENIGFISEGFYKITMESYSFEYKDYQIIISFDQFGFNLKQLKEQIPFIYSNEQEINIEEQTDTYNLKFKLGDYHNEYLILNDLFNLPILVDKCSIEEKDLLCQITKDNIEEKLVKNSNLFNIYYYNDGKELYLSPFIGDITINHYEVHKENIYIGITKLLDNYISKSNVITYETNVTNIKNVHAKFKFNYNSEQTLDCYLKKAETKPLLFYCYPPGDKNYFSLGEIKQTIPLEDVNINYNFYIEPVTNNEKVEIVGDGAKATFSYPYELDFTSKNTTTIYYLMNNVWNTYSIRLNPDANDIQCVNKEDYMKICEVPISHFENKISGIYYSYHLITINYKDKYIPYYELSPIKVILPENNKNITLRLKRQYNENDIQIGQEGMLSIVTNYNDKERNIFNENENITFDGKITVAYKIEHNVSCRLWKPKDDNLRIFCKLLTPLQNTSFLIFNDTSFSYGDYNIVITQEGFLNLKQYKYEIPFLYSDKQAINIDENIETYKLIFNIESYNNDILYIYGQNNNYAVLDNCNITETKLNCIITKDKIEEILILNNEQFKIGAMNDNIGIINLVNIFDITINYENVQKEDIYLKFTKIADEITEIGTPICLETNITSIPNLISEINNEYYYFKKYEGRPLMAFLNFQEEIERDFTLNITEEINYTDIHYKYNFIIHPCIISSNISHSGSGTDIKLTYPNKLDFNSADFIVIRYIMTSPSLSKNVKINPESDELNCENLDGMKKCTVPYIHFLSKESGVYYTHHSNHKDGYSIYYESSPINIILPKDDSFKIYVKDKDNTRRMTIGAPKGIIYFITDLFSNDTDIFNDEIDIEEKTEFTTTITDDKLENFNVTCRLWNPKNEKIRIFCELNNFLYLTNNIKINSAFFNYKNKKIAIISKMNFNLEVRQKDRVRMPFIYSDKQIINVDADKDIYEIKLKILNYDNEKLILVNKENNDFELNHIMLDECDFKEKDLTCKISREKIEELLGKSGEMFKLLYLNKDLGDLYNLENVFTIIINYNSIQKENVYITITKLLEKSKRKEDYIAYETDIKNISNIITNFFIYEKDDSTKILCLMRKSTDQPLLILFKIKYFDEFSLGEIKEEIVLDNINIKYNLIIKPVTNNDKVTLNENGGNLLFAYPMTLDFYISETLTINFYGDKSNANIALLNPDSAELACESNNKVKTCNVSKSHFEGKQSGYYYTYYRHGSNEYSIFYELSPINVLLPDPNAIIIKIKNSDNINMINIGEKGAIAFITDFLDVNNTFAPSDIEEKTAFTATFSGNDNSYKADCHLWKPLEDKLRLICKFNDIINSPKIKLNKADFHYNDLNITIFSEDNININQLNSKIAFLYSDKQDINVTDKTDIYEIKFKKEKYNNEILALYKKNNNNKNIYISLNCKTEEKEKEIKCSIEKNKLIGVLSTSGENYGLVQLTESEGVLLFNDVLNITINYEKDKKEDIILNITKLLTSKVDKRNYIVYETNITKLPEITTDYFNIISNRNDELKCFFKNNDDKLLLLCDAENSGENQLGKIDQLLLNDINILYNFEIVATENNDKYTVSDIEGPIILSVNPLSLNFSLNDSFIIKYQVENSEKFKGIKLNEKSFSELNCEDKKGIVECTIPKSHFENSGEYHTYYNNSFNEKSIAYEIPRINVYIKKKEGGDGDTPEDDQVNVGLIVGCCVGGVFLIAIIVFFIVRAYRRKNQNGNSENDNLLPASVQTELEGETVEE